MVLPPHSNSIFKGAMVAITSIWHMSEQTLCLWKHCRKWCWCFPPMLYAMTLIKAVVMAAAASLSVIGGLNAAEAQAVGQGSLLLLTASVTHWYM